MSTYIGINVMCDEPGCTERLSFSASNEGGLNVSGALRSANRRYGWATTSAAEARCLQHRKVALKFHPFEKAEQSWMGEMCAFAMDSRGRLCHQYPDSFIHHEEPT